MDSDLGLRATPAIAPGTWWLVAALCILLVMAWLMLRKKQANQGHQGYTHQRFPLGQHCYLITIEAHGKRHTLYESQRGLIELQQGSCNQENFTDGKADGSTSS